MFSILKKQDSCVILLYCISSHALKIVNVCVLLDPLHTRLRALFSEVVSVTLS